MISAAIEAEIVGLSPDERREFLDGLRRHRARPEPADPPGLRASSTSSRSSPPASRRSAPGPSAAAPMPPRRPARSTPTSSVASSAPRSRAGKIMVRLGSEAAVKAKGLLRVEGKEYGGSGRRRHALPLQRLKLARRPGYQDADGAIRARCAGRIGAQTSRAGVAFADGRWHRSRREPGCAVLVSSRSPSRSRRRWCSPGRRARARAGTGCPRGTCPGAASAAGEGEKATSAVPLSDDPAVEYKRRHRRPTRSAPLRAGDRALRARLRPVEPPVPALQPRPGVHAVVRAVERRLTTCARPGGCSRTTPALADDPKMDQEQRDDAEAQIAKIDERAGADRRAHARRPRRAGGAVRGRGALPTARAPTCRRRASSRCTRRGGSGA